MIYLNNAATSHPKPEQVYEEVLRELKGSSANAGRSAHSAATDAGRTIFATRDKLATLFGLAHADRIVFTCSATAALNLALLGLLKPGDHCLTTRMEHNALGRPLHHLATQGVLVEQLPCSPRGELDPKAVAAAITSRTKLIALTHASNVIGTLTPLEAILDLAHAHGVPVLVDAAQTGGSVPLDAGAMGIDLLACPGHKGLFGPQGTGFLYVAPTLQLEPILFGGTGSRSAELDMPDFLPDRHEAGTPNLPGIAGLGAGVQFLLDQAPGAVRSHEVALCGQLLEGLAAIPGLELYGVPDPADRASVVTCNLQGADPADLGNRLDEDYDLAVRVGLHCAPDAHRTLGTFPRGAVRLSPGFFTTASEIDSAVAAIRAIAHELQAHGKTFTLASS